MPLNDFRMTNITRVKKNYPPNPINSFFFIKNNKYVISLCRYTVDEVSATIPQPCPLCSVNFTWFRRIIIVFFQVKLQFQEFLLNFDLCFCQEWRPVLQQGCQELVFGTNSKPISPIGGVNCQESLLQGFSLPGAPLDFPITVHFEMYLVVGKILYSKQEIINFKRLMARCLPSLRNILFFQKSFFSEISHSFDG